MTKTSQGGTGAFTFTGTNGWTSQTITTTTAGTGMAGATQALAAASTATTITETAVSGYATTAISCTGLGSGGTATPNLSAASVTLDAAATAAGSNIACTFTNTATGTTYWDGPNTTANGVVNGGTSTWNATTTNWTLSTGTPNGIWAGSSNIAVFQGTAGTVTVSGTQSIGGLTFNTTGYTLKNGTLNGAAASNLLTVTNAADSATVGSVLSGANAFEKVGDGTLSITTKPTYTGSTTVSAGTLVAGTAGLSFQEIFTNTSSVNIKSGATLRLDANDIFTQAKPVPVKVSGKLATNNSTNYVGDLTLDGGTVVINGGAICCSPLYVYDTVTSTGTSSVTLGPNAGRLVIGNSAAAGTVTTFNVTGSLDIAAGLSGWASGGNNGITKTGQGTLSLTGASSYTAITTISAGTLQVGSGGTTGSIDSNSGTRVSTGATLKFNRSDAYTSSKVIDGGGAVTQAGAGTTTLSATNTYTGATTVSAGTLSVTGVTASGATTVSSGATLKGTGSLGNTVTIQSGGKLSPGLSPGTITMSGLVLSSGSILDMELGQAGTVAGTYNDLVQVNGNLSLAGGTLNITQSAGGSFTAGTYRLINYTGTLSNSGGLVIGTVPAGFNMTVDTSIGGQVNLIVSPVGTYWDGPNTTANNVVDGGTSTWNATTTNWTLSTGTPNGIWAGSSNIAVFQGTAGTVTVSGTQSIGGLTFNVGGYTITGGAIAPAAYSSTLTVTNAGDTATVNTPITTAGQATSKAGSGTLVLGGSNYLGYVGVDAGTLVANSTTALGGGTLGVSSGATLEIAASSIGTYQLQIAGNGVGGNGALRVQSPNSASFSNQAFLLNASSRIQVESGAALAINTQIYASSAQTLEKTGGGTLTINSDVMQSGGSTLTVSAGTVLYNGNTSGSYAAANATVASGATWGGKNSAGSRTNAGMVIQSGGNLTPGLAGASIGSLFMNTLALNSGAILNMELGQAGTPGGSLNDLVSVENTGTLTLSGATLNLAQSSGGTFGPGTYRLINYSGSCTGCAAGGLVLGTVPSGFTASRLRIDYSTPNQVNLIVDGPKVRVQKITTGGFGGPFSFTQTNLTGNPANITTNAAATAMPASPTAIDVTASGTAVTITETLAAGYALTGVTCTDANSATTSNTGAFATVSGNILTIPAGNVKAGADFTCVFTNAKLPTVTLTKTSQGGAGAFTFTGNNGWASQTITTTTAGTGVAGATQTLTAAATATTITETAVAGYATTAISCTGLGSGGTATPNLSAGSVTLDAAATAAGSAIACTFTNSKTATVRLQKTTTGGFGGPFSFAQSNLASTPGNISTISAGTAAPTSPAAIAVTTLGTAVTLTETSAAGYALTGATCTDANSAITGNTGTFATLSGNVLTIPQANVKAGSDFTCVFTNALVTGTYWDGPNTTANNVVDGGSSTWDATTTNWTLSSGTPNGIWAAGSSIATFQGAAGTVTVSGTQSMGGLTFGVDGYLLSGGTLTGAATNNVLTVTNGTDKATIGSVLAGSNPMVKQGAGTLVLTANNTYSGTTTVSAGTLQVGNGGSTGDISQTGLQIAGGATLTLYRNSTLNNIYGLPFIEGQGTLRTKGTGVAGQSVYIFSEQNSFAGNAIVEPGSQAQIYSQAWGTASIAVQSGGTVTSYCNCGDYTYNVTLAGNGWNDGSNQVGALQMSHDSTWTGSITLAANSRITAYDTGGLQSGGASAGPSTGTITGVISGGYNLEKALAGTLTVSGANTYGGSTTVSGGTLKLGANGTLPSASATIVASAATLDMNSKTQTLSAGLNSSGTLALGTGGVLTLSGGTSTIAGANVTGSGKIIVKTGATLTLTSALVNSGVEIELAGGTLNLGVLTHSIGKLTVSAASTLDFASATGVSQLTADTLALGSNTLNVTNWTRGTDKFYATAFTGATRNTIGAAPMNLITLTGYSPAYTVWQSDNEINVLLNPKLRIGKTSVGGVGTFNFTMTGLSATSDSITTATAGTTVLGVAGLTGTNGAAATITESGVPSGWPANPASASCTDANSATTGNTGTFGSLSGSILSVPAARIVAGADITCTFVNGLNRLNGFVFNDGGAPSGSANTGTPNDGIRNGSEAGWSGIAVSLTDCSATVYANTTTDSNTGAWSLNLPATVATGTTVCVAAAVPSTSLATGANAGGTAIPDGSTVTVGGIAYTYSRSAQRLSFASPAGGMAVMSFGEVPRSTFVTPGARQVQPNNTVTYNHSFVAGTGGNVVFSITGEAATPVNPAATWSGQVYADAGCTGTLQAGATQLYPGGVATSVVQGQTVCVVVKEQVPATAAQGTVNQTTVQGALTFTNAAPALSATYTLVDTTTVGDSDLSLLKEVRNLTTGGTFSASNQAKSGQELEYRITYTNTGATPMTKVVITDNVPAYTTFELATAGAAPAGLGNCTMNTPQNPTPAAAVSCTATQGVGGTGAVKWMFDGTLNPSSSGVVSFKVKVD